jgi:CBS domain containing-hemolysin-like protein
MEFVLLIMMMTSESQRTLTDFRRDFPTVHEADSIHPAIEKRLERSEHITLITDRLGDTEGIVTSEDIVENLLELEIADRQDAEANMQKIGRRRWHGCMQRQGIDDTPSELFAKSHDG